jgi:integrase
MSTYKPKGQQVFVMDFIFQGVRIKESTHQRTKSLANRVERNRREELESGRSGFKKAEGPKLFKVVAEDWHDMKKVSWSENTARIARTDLDHILPVLGMNFSTELSAEDIASYQRIRKEKGAANKTINNEIGTIRAVLIFCGQWARVQGNTKSPKVKMLKQRESHGRALSADEETRLLAECSKSRSRSVIVIAIVALYTIARFGVIVRLKWKNVNFASRCLQWGKDKTVSGDHRIIPLAGKAFLTLQMWAEQFPDRKPDDYVFPSERYGGSGHLFKPGKTTDQSIAYDTDPSTHIGSIKTAWQGAQTRAKVRCRVHDLRHTGITRMLMAGTSLQQIGEIAGWSPSQYLLMARRYSHFTTEQHRDAVESIGQLLPPASHSFEQSHRKSHRFTDSSPASQV